MIYEAVKEWDSACVMRCIRKKRTPFQVSPDGGWNGRVDDKKYCDRVALYLVFSREGVAGGCGFHSWLYGWHQRKMTW